MTAAGRSAQAPDRLLCWLWLACALGPGSRMAGQVLDWCGGDPCRAWLRHTDGAFRQMAGRRGEKKTPEDFRPVLDRCRAKKIQIIPFGHDDYPLSLSRLPDLPLVLYCTGSPAWLNAPCLVGMVGSRSPDEYGLRGAQMLGQGLAQHGAVIVSGLAGGLDTACHQAAVEAGAATIGVQGVAIDRTYPAANRPLRAQMEAHGCVVGEYPPGENGAGRNGFLLRNRLIAGLSRALVVVQAREKSGTLSTVGHAVRYGRAVYALPGDVTREASAGTNRLLQEGRARAVLAAGDLLDQLDLDGAAPARQVRPLSAAERQVLACLTDAPRRLEALAAGCGMSQPELAAVLMQLSLAGYLRELPGQQYSLL